MTARAAAAAAPALAGRDRRGLTLIELLLVIALLVALGAVVLPVVDRRLDEQTFETTADLVSVQLRLARFHASDTDRPVAVNFLADPERIEATFFAIGPANDEQDAPARRIDEAWALRALPEGTSIAAHPPPWREGDRDSFSAAEKESRSVFPSAAEEGTRILRLAVYLPDGSALVGEPAWVWDADRRLGRLTINRWTGGSTWERVDPDAPESPAPESPAPESPEPESPAPEGAR